MWTVIGTVIVPLLKFIFERIAKKKLNDAEFLEHIEAHQKRRQGAGQASIDFEDSLDELEDEMGESENTDT